MRTEEEVRENLKFTEFVMDEYFDHLRDTRMWNTFVSNYWLLKWVLGETGVQSSNQSTIYTINTEKDEE